MKSYKNYIIAAGFIGMLTSCTDLDTPVSGYFTEYPTDPAALEGVLSGVYYQARGVLGRRYSEAQGLSSDEWVGISFSGDYYDNGTYAHTCLHNFSPDDATIDWYEQFTTGIGKANNAIAMVGGNDAEAAVMPRAIRAFYHWALMDSYGDIVISKGAEDDSTNLRSPRPEVAQFIADELEEVIPKLTTTVDESTYGKPTRWMAEALLAKLYINWPVYTAANVADYDAQNYTNDKLNRVVELCDDIIKSGMFDLSDPYLEKFYPNNGYKIKDFIYAMPYDAVTQQGFQYGRPRAWRKANTDISYFGTTLSKSCGGNFSITPEMSDNLMSLATDDRQEHVLAGTIYMFDPTTYKKTTTPWTYKGTEVVLTKDITLTEQDEKLDVGNDVNGYCQGYKSVKWFITDADFKNDRNQSNDLPIFRYADIILTKAEAILRGATATNGDTPKSLFNQIRSYVHAPLIETEPTLDDIYAERGREFFDENWRRNDMIRFGHFEDEYGFHKKSFPTANFDKSRRIFPIPTSVLNKNITWKQNPGY